MVFYKSIFKPKEPKTKKEEQELKETKEKIADMYINDVMEQLASR